MPRDWGEIGSNDYGDGVSLGDEENVPKLTVVMVTQLFENTKNH